MVDVPQSPQWPGMESVDTPATRTMSLVDPSDTPWGQVWDWLSKKPLYIITDDYFTYCPLLEHWIFLPTNFVYDYASIPRFLTFILRPNGLLGYGAGPHDFGCRFGGMIMSSGPDEPYTFMPMDKPLVDDVFGDLNNKANKLKPINNFATWTVKTFGGKKHKNLMDINAVDWSKPVYGQHYHGYEVAR